MNIGQAANGSVVETLTKVFDAAYQRHVPVTDHLAAVADGVAAVLEALPDQPDAHTLERALHETMLAEAMIETRRTDSGAAVEWVAESVVEDVLPSMASTLASLLNPVFADPTTPTDDAAEWEYGVEYSTNVFEFDDLDLDRVRSHIRWVRAGGRYAETVRAVRRHPAGEPEPIPEDQL